MESLSYSRRSQLKNCPRSFYYKYLMGIEPKILPKPLRMGSAYSNALELADPSEVSKYYMDLPLHMTEELFTEMTIVLALATSYINIYNINNKESYTREVEFGPYQIGNTNYSENGRWDGLDDTTPNAVLILENKLKSQFSSADVKALALDEQCTAYISAARTMYEVPASNILLTYRVTKKPAHRRGKKETEVEFRNRVIGIINEDPTRWHEEHKVTRTDEQLNWYQEELLHAAEYMTWLENKSYPRYTHSCGNYGGCEFLPICVATTSSEAATLIADNYNMKGRNELPTNSDKRDRSKQEETKEQAKRFNHRSIW